MTLGGKITSFRQLKTHVFCFRHPVSPLSSFWFPRLSFLRREMQFSLYLWSSSLTFPLWCLTRFFGSRDFYFSLLVFSGDLGLCETFRTSSECGFTFHSFFVFSRTGSIWFPIAFSRSVSETVSNFVQNVSFPQCFEGVVGVFWLSEVPPSFPFSRAGPRTFC